MKKAILFILLLSFPAFAQMTQTEFNQSFDLLMGDDQQKATSALEALEKIYPGTAEAMYLRGVYQYRDGDSNAALMSFSNAIKSKPGFAMAYDSRARVFYQKGMYDKAVADASEAIKIDPKNANLYISRARYYNYSKMYKEALEDMKTKIKLQPDDAFGYSDAATFAKLADPNANADVYFTQAYANAKIPKPLVDVLYGKYLLGEGRFEEARAKYEASLTAAEKDFYPEDYQDLGIVYYKLKNYDKAVTSFKKAIAMSPTNVDYRCNLASVYIDMNNFEMVKATAKEALAQNSEHPLANMYMAVGLKRTGNDQLAAEYEAKAKRLDAEQNK